MNRPNHRLATILLYVLTLLATEGAASIAVAQAQAEKVDLVYLTNGSIIRGEITEMIPNKSIKIKTRDGSLFVFDMKDVLKTSRETVEATKVATPPVVPPSPIAPQESVPVGASAAPAPRSVGGLSVGAGVGNSYGGDYAAAFEYRGNSLALFGGVGSFDGLVSGAAGVRAYFSGGPLIMEIGYGPLLWQSVTYYSTTTRLYYGPLATMGVVIRPQHRLRWTATVGIGYSDEMRATVLRRSTILAVGAGMLYGLR